MIPGLCSLFYKVGGGSSGGLSVVATPSFAGASGSGSVTSGAFTATPHGGTGPYTYSWSSDSGTVNSPTSASTTITDFLNTGDQFLVTAMCAVSDSASHHATSNQVTCQFTFR